MNQSPDKHIPSQATSTAETNLSSPQSKKPEVLVRVMREDDLEQVQAIDRLSFSMPWPAKAYRFELMENPNSLMWIAETAQSSGETQPPGMRVVGMIVVWMILEEAHIATIAVHPEYRGYGIAKLLMAEALYGAVQRGAERATLEVRAGNQAAQALYKHFNFEIVGKRPKYYKDNLEDALIMTANGLGPDYLEWLFHASWPTRMERLVITTDNPASGKQPGH